VDLTDVQWVAAAWRDNPTDPRYDLDDDNVVTVEDIMLVAMAVGENCAPCVLAADVDDDDDVDLTDVQLVAAVWRDSLADPRYDLNDDGTFTVEDIMLVTVELGDGCP
jgi:hypothetical protein